MFFSLWQNVILLLALQIYLILRPQRGVFGYCSLMNIYIMYTCVYVCVCIHVYM